MKDHSAVTAGLCGKRHEPSHALMMEREWDKLKLVQNSPAAGGVCVRNLNRTRGVGDTWRDEWEQHLR